MQPYNTPARPDRIPPELESQWQRLGVHRANQAARLATWSTGWAALDRILPGGGYPLSAVTEWLVERPGTGELSLLLIALAPRLAARPDDRLVLLNPPYALNAPALDAAGIDRSRVPVIQCRRAGECVWSVEQLAAAGGFVGFVLWDDGLDAPALRRLQLASEKAGCPVFVYRPLTAARERSPAALRLALHGHGARQRIEVIKCRGPAGARLDGLIADTQTPWRLPRTRTGFARIRARPADNDYNDNGDALAHRQEAPRYSSRRSNAEQADHAGGRPE